MSRILPNPGMPMTCSLLPTIHAKTRSIAIAEPRKPMSRLTLSWHNLEQKPGQDLCLKIPVCAAYHPVIDRAFPDLKHIGWRPDTRGTCFTFIKQCSTEQRAKLADFLELLNTVLLLTPARCLQSHFSDELTEAYALGFNFQPGMSLLAYTTVGQLEQKAKEQRTAWAIEDLAARLAETIRRHPTLHRADFIAAMPRRPSSRFHLPIELVDRLAVLLGRPTGLALEKVELPKMRRLTLPKKLQFLTGAFHLHESVCGKSVLIIDDLFQSGSSAWSLARFLKAHGAREVYALACVKSRRDTDNQ